MSDQDETTESRLQALESLIRRALSGSADGALAGDVTGPEAATVLAKIAALAGGGNRLVGVDNAGNIQVGSVVDAPLAGDVTGPEAATVLAKIAALAGGGVQFVAVDNAGNVGTAVPPTPPFAMGGDVTGTTAASVLSKIAALAGGGIRDVAVDNAGNVIAGPSIQSGSVTLITGTLIVPGFNITPTSRIVAQFNTAISGGGGTVKLDIPSASRVVGAPGTFVINALTTADVVNPADASSVDFIIIN